MKLRYFTTDDRGQLRRVRRAWIESLWQGQRLVRDSHGEPVSELRLVSILCDSNLRPQKIYLLRLPLTVGRFTRANRHVLRSFTMRSLVTADEFFRHHSDGWPCDFFRQLAIALDVPRHDLEVPMGIGGPLLMAAALHMPPRLAIRYLR